MIIPLHRHEDDGFDQAVEDLRATLRAGGVSDDAAGGVDVPSAVAEVVADVEARGDQAVAELTARIEGVELTPDRFVVPASQIARARRQADAAFLELVRRVADNVREYQRHILHRDPPELVRQGRRLGVRYTPVDRVAVYVPGAKALYPSTVLMTVVPAQVAGVGEIAMISPPTRGGDVDDAVLALAGELGVGEVYRVSGTAGIAAAAIGTETIRPVDKIVGPGNAFIAEAKRQVNGRVGIDSIAGPSEVLIVADEAARADWLAGDLLAQAEHNPGSAILATPSDALAEAVVGELAAQLDRLDRAEAIRAALARYSAIFVTADLTGACELANRFATEHLQIITSDDDATLSGIRHAGAIFVGAHTPVPLGDYYAGPSHVLPTGGTARFFGPLSCNDFLKASSVIRYDRASLAADARDVVDFATREGLTAHARAVAIRVEGSGSAGAGEAAR